MVPSLPGYTAWWGKSITAVDEPYSSPVQISKSELVVYSALLTGGKYFIDVVFEVNKVF